MSGKTLESSFHGHEVPFRDRAEVGEKFEEGHGRLHGCVDLIDYL